ncbi:MAG: hypothetical protein RMX97_32270 [Nostoc sp. DedQUE11]|nr:hypothetical protein [Nostoc sp. DedQUE11]
MPDTPILPLLINHRTQSCSVLCNQFNGVGVARRRHRIYLTNIWRSHDQGMQ